MPFAPLVGVGLGGRRPRHPGYRPAGLGRLSADRQVSLVSGTNGKTTTTKLLARALSDHAVTAKS